MKSPPILWPKSLGGATNRVGQAFYLGHYPRLYLPLSLRSPFSLSHSLQLMAFGAELKKFAESLMEKLDKVLCENFCVQELKVFSLLLRFSESFAYRTEGKKKDREVEFVCSFV